MTYKLLLFAAAFIMLSSSCNDSIYEAVAIPAGTACQMVQENWADSVDAYRQQVRMGDATAYIRLAHCYHKGLGVRRDFVDMLTMVAMAKDYGLRDAWEVFVDELPSGDPDRLLMEAMDNVGHLRYDVGLQKAALLGSQGNPAADLIMGAVALEREDNAEAERLFLQAAANGCRLARIFASLFTTGKEDRLAVAEDFPMLYPFLAEECLENEENPDESVIAGYYLKAYDALCLPPSGARWLLAYYERQALAGQPTADSATISNMKQMVQWVSKTPR